MTNICTTKTMQIETIRESLSREICLILADNRVMEEVQ